MGPPHPTWAGPAFSDHCLGLGVLEADMEFRGPEVYEGSTPWGRGKGGWGWGERLLLWGPCQSRVGLLGCLDLQSPPAAPKRGMPEREGHGLPAARTTRGGGSWRVPRPRGLQRHRPQPRSGRKALSRPPGTDAGGCVRRAHPDPPRWRGRSGSATRTCGALPPFPQRAGGSVQAGGACGVTAATLGTAGASSRGACRCWALMASRAAREGCTRGRPHAPPAGSPARPDSGGLPSRPFCRVPHPVGTWDFATA